MSNTLANTCREYINASVEGCSIEEIIESRKEQLIALGISLEYAYMKIYACLAQLINKKEIASNGRGTQRIYYSIDKQMIQLDIDTVIEETNIVGHYWDDKPNPIEEFRNEQSDSPININNRNEAQLNGFVANYGETSNKTKKRTVKANKILDNEILAGLTALFGPAKERPKNGYVWTLVLDGSADLIYILNRAEMILGYKPSEWHHWTSGDTNFIGFIYTKEI